MRPGIALTITLALDPYLPARTAGPRARAAPGPARRPWLERLDEEVDPDLFWTIGGRLHQRHAIEWRARAPAAGGKGADVRSSRSRFVIGGLAARRLYPEVSVERRRAVCYHSPGGPDYDLKSRVRVTRRTGLCRKGGRRKRE